MISCHLQFFDLPIFRTNLRFPRRFEKSGLHCIYLPTSAKVPNIIAQLIITLRILLNLTEITKENKGNYESVL